MKGYENGLSRTKNIWSEKWKLRWSLTQSRRNYAFRLCHSLTINFYFFSAFFLLHNKKTVSCFNSITEGVCVCVCVPPGQVFAPRPGQSQITGSDVMYPRPVCPICPLAESASSYTFLFIFSLLFLACRFLPVVYLYKTFENDIFHMDYPW